MLFFSVIGFPFFDTILSFTIRITFANICKNMFCKNAFISKPQENYIALFLEFLWNRAVALNYEIDQETAIHLFYSFFMGDQTTAVCLPVPSECIGYIVGMAFSWYTFL